MKRLVKFITVLCLFAVLTIDIEPSIYIDDQAPHHRSNRSFIDEPIHPRVQKDD